MLLVLKKIPIPELWSVRLNVRTNVEVVNLFPVCQSLASRRAFPGSLPSYTASPREQQCGGCERGGSGPFAAPSPHSFHSPPSPGSLHSSIQDNSVTTLWVAVRIEENVSSPELGLNRSCLIDDGHDSALNS
jgi:hypothetical protein